MRKIFFYSIYLKIVLTISILFLSSCTTISYSDSTIDRYKSKLNLPADLDSINFPKTNNYFFGSHVYPSITENQDLLLELISKQRDINILNKKIKGLKKSLNREIEILENSFRKDTLELHREKKLLRKEISHLISGRDGKKILSKNNIYVLFGLYESEEKVDSHGKIYDQKSFLWGVYEWKEYK
ncbi:MAG: hypothetical protein CR982_07325 [Candidatus Cloacimonadota bacterium]|nr:MAG: hypothetical protein CR982_07325 [Candidatus Cloacimonadota bacterium]PIE79452.1 MAG: hypothetical protein CSA15_03100 [Candidatus Delongbacteria bacterium]